MGAGTLSFQISQAGLLSRERQVSFHLCCVCLGLRTCSSPLISTLIWSLMEPETEERSDLFSRWYHTSISPDRVRTSMIVCPRKSSLSRVSFCRSRAFRSLSSSQTRTLMRSLELWHSLKQWWMWIHSVIALIEYPMLKSFLQWELLVPLWVQFLRNRLCTFLGLADLDRDVGVAGPRLVLGDEALGAHHWNTGVRTAL